MPPRSGPGLSTEQKAQIHPFSVDIAVSLSIQIQSLCGSHWEPSWRFHSPLPEKGCWQAVHVKHPDVLSDLGKASLVEEPREAMCDLFC
jgi:hypothetical protein